MRQADWISTLAKWGVGAFFLMIGMGWCASLVSPSRSTAAPAARTPAQSSGPITAEDMKPEKTGRLGSRKVSALEKDGTWMVTFEPALPRNDRTVLEAAEYALREFLKVDTRDANWRPTVRSQPKVDDLLNGLLRQRVLIDGLQDRLIDVRD